MHFSFGRPPKRCAWIIVAPRGTCKEKNIVLNEKKAELFKEELTFMGHRISKDGVKPDPVKTEAITAMPKPSDIHGVKRF